LKLKPPHTHTHTRHIHATNIIIQPILSLTLVISLEPETAEDASTFGYLPCKIKHEPN
jgi:hypothetical protein